MIYVQGEGGHERVSGSQQQLKVRIEVAASTLGPTAWTFNLMAHLFQTDGARRSWFARADEILQACLKRRRIPDRFLQFWKNILFEKLRPLRQGLAHAI